MLECLFGFGMSEKGLSDVNLMVRTSSKSVSIEIDLDVGSHVLL